MTPAEIDAARERRIALLSEMARQVNASAEREVARQLAAFGTGDQG